MKCNNCRRKIITDYIRTEINTLYCKSCAKEISQLGYLRLVKKLNNRINKI